jgi:16S rRNA G966 N2-methylase RsmD
VLAFLEQQVAGPYDVVFCDPPFADVAILEATLAHSRLARALAPEAYVVARVLRKHQPRVPEGARVLRVKEIGEETLLFLRYDGVRGGG